MTLSLPAMILLAILQGLSEFLPISSSGHLVIAQALLNVPQQGILLEVVLHAGTLVAVVILYARELRHIFNTSIRSLAAIPREGTRAFARAREGWLLVLATLPVVFFGAVLHGPVERAFEEPRAASGFLFITGLILLATKLFAGRRAVDSRVALAMGIGQVVSLLPGISRSGATISAGLFTRGRAVEVVRFSFLMSVLAVLGALVFQLRDLDAATLQAAGLVYLAGFIVSALTGILAIKILLRVVARGQLHYFGIYCLIAGVFGWWLLGRT